MPRLHMRRAPSVLSAYVQRCLGISIRTLEKHRTYGTGPTYRIINYGGDGTENITLLFSGSGNRSFVSITL
ncbi:hypothetical protein DPM13_07840 [Paracoccus mutanolyticus]|uniref:Uncharacterized protein n=1 Tax=Paracoccus mutanolyticus TaxID=1499308 RepID=A0ABN5M5L7_9RHOB|nr:hypothetical protein DPM13_07840 [Paracoccus mutanolyticus]